MGKVGGIIGGCIGLTLAITVGTVATSVAMVVDNSDIDNSEVINANIRPIDYLYNKVQKELDKSYESKDVSLLFDNKDIEYILYPILTNLDLSPFTIQGFTVDYINDAYEIAIKISYDNNVSTIARASISINQKDDGFKIQIVDVKIGKIEYQKVIKIANRFGVDIDSEENQKSVDESIPVGKADLTDLSYELKYSDLLDYLSKQNDYQIIYDTLEVLLENKDLVEISLGSNNLLGVLIHLNRLLVDHEEKGFANIDLRDNLDKINQLLSEGKITKNDAENVFNYLVKGFPYISENEYSQIKDLDLSSIGIIDKALYFGSLNRNALTINDAFSNIIHTELFTNLLLDKKIELTLTDNEISTILMNQNFIGQSFVFTNTLDLQASYISIKQLYVNTNIDDILVDLIVDINGNDIYIEAKANANTATGYAINSNISRLSIGDLDLKESQLSGILTLLKGYVNESWISIDDYNRAINLNFEEVLSQNVILNEQISIMRNLGFNYQVYTSIIDDGVKITYSFDK